MELPTYTGIWRIEKRLYKLYDFRLPIPLPVGQIAVFAAITVPYVVLLTLFGLPFSHNLFWLYVLPPGLLTWLATRPVLESKRLPELIISQARYIGEPSTWCRMAPLAENDEIVVFGRVWRRVAVAAAVTTEQEAIEKREAARELSVPERAALPVGATAAQVASGQSVAEQLVPEKLVAEQPVRGRASAGPRDRQLRVRQAIERQVRERQQQIREEEPTGPVQEQRVRETAEAPGTRWGRRAAGTIRRQVAPAPAVPGSPPSAQAPPTGDGQRPPAADAGWTRGVSLAADAAVRRDASAVAPPRAGRHAGPIEPAAVVNYSADTGVRPEGTGAEPRPDGKAGRGSGAGAVGDVVRARGAGAVGDVVRVSDPGRPGNGDRSVSGDHDPGVVDVTGLADATGLAGAAGLAGAIGYALGASGPPAPDTGAWGYAGDTGGKSFRDAGPGAGVAGAVGYVAGADARPGGPARDSGPGGHAGTGWPSAKGTVAGWLASNGAGPDRLAGNGAGAGVPPGRGAAPGADQGMATDQGLGTDQDLDTVEDIGWPVGYPAATSLSPAAPVRGIGPAADADAAEDADDTGSAADTGPAGDAGPAADTSSAGDVRPAADTGSAKDIGPAVGPGPGGEADSVADSGLAKAGGTEPRPAHQGREAGPANAESGTAGADAASGGDAEPGQVGHWRPWRQTMQHPAAPSAPSPARAPQPPAPRPADPRSSVAPLPAPRLPVPLPVGPRPSAPSSANLRPSPPRPAGPRPPAPSSADLRPSAPPALAPQPSAPPPVEQRSALPPAPAPQPSAPPPVEQRSAAPHLLAPLAPVSPSAEPPPPAPVVVVPAQQPVAGPSQAAPARPRPAPVERELSGPDERRSVGWRGHVTVVSGGRGPGRPDHVKEARSRAVLPLDRPRLVVVLGCTVGAGQTVTALMLADLLAGLRAEPVAALDLNPGPASLTGLAGVPAITVSALLADRAPGAHAAHRGAAGPAIGNRTRSRLDVICQDADPDGGVAMSGLQFDRLAGLLASRYTLTLADPGAPSVARLLAQADQLVLVAPASPDAARAVSMTCEWLGGHEYAALAKHSIAVLNGVSQRSVRHAEQAELVLRGRCRAIVRVPWDDHLAEPEAERGIRDSLEAADGQSRLARLRPAVLQAYTALAGVLVSSLADDPARRKVAP